MAVNGLPPEVRQQLWKQWWDDVVNQMMVEAASDDAHDQSTTEDAA